MLIKTRAITLLTIIAVLLAGGGLLVRAVSQPRATAVSLQAMPVPTLPFDDNPDPAACGIPQPWTSSQNRAWLTGQYRGQLVQPIVYLYDSHLRKQVTASAPSGTEVEIILFQRNPKLNYYYVRLPDTAAGEREAWIPAPFLTFDNPG